MRNQSTTNGHEWTRKGKSIVVYLGTILCLLAATAGAQQREVLKATATDALAGTNNTRYMTPARVFDAVSMIISNYNVVPNTLELVVTGLTGNEEPGLGTYNWSGIEYYYGLGGITEPGTANWWITYDDTLTNWAMAYNVSLGTTRYYYTNNGADPWLGTWYKKQNGYGTNFLAVSGLTQNTNNGTFTWSAPELAYYLGTYNGLLDQWSVYASTVGHTNWYMAFDGVVCWTNLNSNPWTGTWYLYPLGYTTNFVTISGMTGDEADGNGAYVWNPAGSSWTNDANSRLYIAWNDVAWAVFSNATPSSIELFTNTAGTTYPWTGTYQASQGIGTAPTVALTLTNTPTVALGISDPPTVNYSISQGALLQTPWATNIDAAGHSLSNVVNLRATNIYGNVTGNLTGNADTATLATNAVNSTNYYGTLTAAQVTNALPAIITNATSANISASQIIDGTNTATVGVGSLYVSNTAAGLTATGNVHRLMAGGSDVLVVTNGNVGLETDTPFSKLQIRAPVGGVITTRQSSTVNMFETYSSTKPTLNLYTTDTSATDVGGSIGLGGRTGDVGADPFLFAVIKGAKEAGEAYGGYLSFTMNRNASPVEAMRITSAGNVGIGTNAPRYNLNVSDFSGTANKVLFGVDSMGDTVFSVDENGAVTNKGTLTSGGSIQTLATGTGAIKSGKFISNNSGAIGDFGAYDGGFYFVNAEQGAISFVTQGTDRMKLSMGGNLGVNTTNPTNTLQVHGTALVTGNTYFGGTSNHFVHTVVASNILLSVPAWKDLVHSPAVLSKGGTAVERQLLAPGSTTNTLITVDGWKQGSYGDGEAQFNHDLARTNAAFPNLYIVPHLHLSVTNLPTGKSNTTWTLIYNWSTIGENLTTALHGTITNTWTLEALKHSIVGFTPITNNAANGTVSSIFSYRLMRLDGGDGDLDDADGITRLHDFDIHYPVNRLGSTEPASY